jgi:peptidoglycan-associated lipoprotein
MEMKFLEMKYIFAIVLFSFSVVLSAQPYREATYEAKLAAADDLAAEGFYLDAVDMYRECYSESRDLSLLATIAHCEFLYRDFSRSKRSFERVFRKVKKDEVPDLVFMYARILKMEGDYEDAYRHFKIVLENSISDSLSTLCNNEIEGMKMATDLEPRYDLYVEPIDKTINTAFSDMAPVEGPNGELFYSNFDRNSYVEFEAEGEEDEKRFAKIRFAKAKDDGSWEKPKEMAEDINYDGYHIGSPSFSVDGSQLFFTRSIIRGKSVVESDVYTSTYDGINWTAPVRLKGINGEYPVLHPVPGELYGESVLFFISDRPGGYGGYDIYYAPKRGENTYGLAVNLGEEINSLGDEFTPFYTNGYLYFSSDGHPTAGGMDIFNSEWDGEKWSKPENLGTGYNSRYDDFFYKYNYETDKGYLVSNRSNDKIRSLRGEHCCDNIYTVGIKDIEIDVLVSAFADREPLKGAVIEVAEINQAGDIINSNSASSDKTNTFKFRLQADKKYRVYTYKDGFVKDSTEISTMGMNKSYTFKKQFSLEPAEPETEIVTINQPIRMNNIYYDYDDDKILPDAEQDLQNLYNLMQEYPEMVIELSSHTDARGDDNYNVDLSQRRANNAKKWLVQKGVDSDRIVAKGYGESQILNECTNGVECSEEQHRKNRRTEFKIIEGPETIEIKKEVIKGTNRTPKGKLRIDE